MSLLIHNQAAAGGSILRMGIPRRSKASEDLREWAIPRADRIDGAQAVVAATVVLDILVAIKMDLTATPMLGTDEGYGLHDRVERACATIEAAICAFKRVSDPHADGNWKSARR